MKVKNSNGPITVPCGTPDITSAQEDVTPSNTTFCVLLLKKSCTRRSCESQLIITIDALGKSLAKGEQVDVILLDFSKAFDIKGSPSSTASQAGLLWNERKHLEMGTGFLE
jgi:hypothetical protein